MTESAAKKAAELFRYKPQAKLSVDDPTLWDRMVLAGSLRLTQATAAVLLGCSADTLQRFWKDCPEYREAYEAGKELDNVRTARLLRMHAVTDPGTARFLAKNYLELSDDPSKAKADEATADALKSMSRQEAEGRILELKAKLVGETVYGETKKDEQEQPTGASHNGTEDLERSELVEQRRIRGTEDAAEAQGQQVLLGPLQEGLAQPQALPEGQGKGVSHGQDQSSGGDSAQKPQIPHGAQQKASRGSDHPGNGGENHGDGGRGGQAQRRGELPVPGGQGVLSEPTAIDRLQARLAELEASAVRKNPRKDGQPHTDRTRVPAEPPTDVVVDAASNNRQERPHAPGRLPGRLGQR